VSGDYDYGYPVVYCGKPNQILVSRGFAKYLSRDIDNLQLFISKTIYMRNPGETIGKTRDTYRVILSRTVMSSTLYFNCNFEPRHSTLPTLR
jgi:hypothetical protein